MTVLEQRLSDVSRFGVPITLIGGLLVSVLIAGMWLGKRDTTGELSASNIAELKVQVQNLSDQVTQISVSLAKGPTLPESVAYKADLLRFCILNKNLTCPQF